jgi:hypothetical protein
MGEIVSAPPQDASKIEAGEVRETLRSLDRRQWWSTTVLVLI